MQSIALQVFLQCLLVFLASPQSTCSAYCDIQYNGNPSPFGCTDQTSTGCTKCFSQLFQLSGTTCVLKTQSSFIYNSTTEIPFTSWTENSAANIDSAAFSTKTYYRFRGVASASLNYTIPSTHAHYGIRFRFWVYYESPNNNQMYFYLNGTLQQTSLNGNTPIDSMSTWIITTDHLNYTEDVVTFTFVRTDGHGTTYYAGVDDFLIFIAECVVGCTSCTSLNDCRACTAGYFLNNQTNLCMVDCGVGMYEGVSFCENCDPKCLTCDISSTNCQLCTDEGVNEAFLNGSACYLACPNGMVENHLTHQCDCGQGYYMSGGICSACHAFCLTCFAGDQNSCYDCSEGYYLQNSTNTCSIYCPTGQYFRQGVEIYECYLCDLSFCTDCEGSSISCTACLFPTNDKYLYNHECVNLCPDGYEQNNTAFTCDACPAATYSYQQVCISECPQYYSESEELRACVLSEHSGYPLNLTLQVADTTTISLSMTLELGISATNKTQLETDFQNRVALTLIEQENNTVQVIVGATTTSLTIDSLTITNNVLTLSSSSFTPYQLTPLHSFKVQFSDNIYSTNNVMYTLSTIYSFNDNPSDLHSFLESYISGVRFIVLPMIIISLLFLLIMVKHSFFAWLEYLHCVQLLGLTLYNLFPYSLDLILYSFMVGVDYANFSYIYNVPLNFIAPCTSCASFSGFIFIQDDMDFLRNIGSILQLFLFMCILVLILVNIECSKNYGFRLMKLIVPLIMIKCLHSWFASLVGVGLDAVSSYSVGTYVLGLVFLAIFWFHQYKWKSQYGFINLRLASLVVYVLLIIFLSFAPVLICCLLMTWSMIEWLLMHQLQINDHGVPQMYAVDKKDESDLTSNTQQNRKGIPCEQIFHRELTRSFRPIIVFLIASVIMISYSLTIIILISTVLATELILLIMDTSLLCQLSSNLQKVKNEVNQTQEYIQDNKQDEVNNERVRDSQIIKEKKQSNAEKYLEEKEDQKEEQKDEKASAIVVVADLNEDEEDDVIDDRFRKRRKKAQRSNLMLDLDLD